MPRTAKEVIVAVLTNGRVKSEFSHESLAQQIIDTLGQIGADTRNVDERKRDMRALSAPAPQWIESLKYRIEHRDAGDNILEVLGREHRVSPARAAFEAYRQEDPSRLLLLIEGGGRVIMRSDRRT